MQIITGKTGTPHITSVHDRALNQGIIGKEAYILDTGSNLEAEIYTANEIRIKDGMLVTQGCCAGVEVGTYDSVTISNGSQGMKRKDLIVARYKYDNSQDKESMEWAVIQGTPHASEPVMPSVTNTGDIQKRETIVDTAVFVVDIDGVAIESVEKLINISPAANNSRKILWSGNTNLEEGVIINLNEPISKQPNGAIFVFGLSSTDNGEAYGSFGTLMIPKEIVGMLDGKVRYSSGITNFAMNCRKVFKVEDDRLIGDASNVVYGNINGMYYNNTRMKLIKVMGW